MRTSDLKVSGFLIETIGVDIRIYEIININSYDMTFKALDDHRTFTHNLDTVDDFLASETLEYTFAENEMALLPHRLKLGI